jgi:hypothetical protein
LSVLWFLFKILFLQREKEEKGAASRDQFTPLLYGGRKAGELWGKSHSIFWDRGWVGLSIWTTSSPRALSQPHFIRSSHLTAESLVNNLNNLDSLRPLRKPQVSLKASAS